MHQRHRRGTASVELAVCLPLFVLVVFGAVEACSLIHLKETLKTASYEAARVTAKATSKEQDAIERATRIVQSRGLTIGSVTFSPSDLASVPVGGTISATVTVDPASQGDALILSASVLGQSAVSATTTMAKESE